MRLLSTAVIAAVALPCVMPAAFAADDVTIKRDANGSLHITIEGHRDPEPAKPSPKVKPESKYTDEERDAVSVKFSLERSELEKKLNALAADLDQTRREVEETERKEFTARVGAGYYAESRGATAGAAQAAEASRRFEQEKRGRLEDLRSRKRAQLRELAKLEAGADKLRTAVAQFYGGKPPAWWRDVSCPACPSPSEIAAELER